MTQTGQAVTVQVQVRGEKRKRNSRNRDASSIMPVVKSYRRRISMPAVTKTNGKFIEQERKEKSGSQSAKL
jgi:hypothetical protein